MLGLLWEAENLCIILPETENLVLEKIYLNKQERKTTGFIARGGVLAAGDGGGSILG
jgi:hypothetical protein